MADKKRLIDVNETKEHIWNVMKSFRSTLSLRLWLLVIKLLDDMPTVDAEEVVRCKGCRHWHYSTTKDFHYCMYTMMGRVTKPDDFCSYGERRADNA